jgi:hypothetical protein
MSGGSTLDRRMSEVRLVGLLRISWGSLMLDEVSQMRCIASSGYARCGEMRGLGSTGGTLSIILVSRRLIVLARAMRPRGVSELRRRWAFSIMVDVWTSLIEGKDSPVDVEASMCSKGEDVEIAVPIFRLRTAVICASMWSSLGWSWALR